MAEQQRRAPRLLTVKQTFRLTPNMIRVTFAGPELQGIPAGREGANCKIMLPAEGQSRDDFAAQLQDGHRPTTRTYTVRHFREETLEMDIDFVAHGDEGPASAWALKAKPGDFLGFAGPGTVKVTHYSADFYIVAADSSALPVAAATLEAMPGDAKGVAIFEIPTEADRQDIAMPSGIEAYWFVHADPHVASTAQQDFIRSMPWPKGRIQTCIAGENSVIKDMRTFLLREKGLTKDDAYIAGYWKIGLIEDEHQKMKRQEAEAA